jgi:tRNA threonylcarbamoyladenosine biosynthesis protein TsaE
MRGGSADARGLRKEPPDSRGEEPPVSFRSESAAETEAIGERIGAGLGPGDVVLVSGELGTGKTTLIRGACRALGVTEPVTSPTFTIGHRYRGRLPVSHLDLYRLEGLDREDPGLLDDYLDQDSVALIEWPENAAARIERISAQVNIRHAGGDEREVETQYP